MRRKIIKATIVALPLLMLSMNNTYASDDFDCTTLDMDTMEEIKEKLDSGEDLTSDEEEIMENAQSCGGPQWGQGWQGWPQGGWMNNDNKEKVEDSVDDDSGLSTKIQSAIDKLINSLESSLSSLDDDDQIEKYEAIVERLEWKLEIILDNDDIDEDKQELFENILNEMINQIEDLIDELED